MKEKTNTEDQVEELHLEGIAVVGPYRDGVTMRDFYPAPIMILGEILGIEPRVDEGTLSQSVTMKVDEVMSQYNLPEGIASTIVGLDQTYKLGVEKIIDMFGSIDPDIMIANYPSVIKQFETKSRDMANINGSSLIPCGLLLESLDDFVVDEHEYEHAATRME
jgi:hypothetical protein